MISIRNVIEESLAEIRPNKAEEREKRSRIRAFTDKLRKFTGDANVILGGSAKKETWLRDSYDADIFVAFPYAVYKERSSELSDILEERLKKVFTLVRVHGSRDYFQTTVDGFVFEIIPILEIKDSRFALNITDISPLHAKWVRKNVADPDQVRLAKAFSQANGFYGAESFIKGFSGYCIEVLIVHYKDFLGLIEAASRWGNRTVIDIMKYHTNIGIEVNRSKLESPLVLIDPVQKGRNVAAALSIENYKKMISASRRFLRSPSKEAFIRKGVSVKTIRSSHKKAIIISARPRRGKEDVIGSKLLKVHEFIASFCESKGFILASHGWHWDRKDSCLMWYVPKISSLPPEMEWKGPPVTMDDHVKSFKKAYKKTFVKDGMLYATIKREHTEILACIRSAIGNGYVSERVAEIQLE